MVSILAAFTMPSLAKEGGAYLYTERQIDIALPLSEQISNQSDSKPFKRAEFSEVIVKSDSKEVEVRTVFKMRRNSNLGKSSYNKTIASIGINVQ